MRAQAMLLAVLVLGLTPACFDTQGEEDRAARTDCIGCHNADYVGARRHVDQKPTTCGVCHSETSWLRATRRHLWPLEGKHEKADCFGCHSGRAEDYDETPTACFACHEDDFTPAPFPEHDTFSHECEKCHTTSGWKPLKEGAERGGRRRGKP